MCNLDIFRVFDDANAPTIIKDDILLVASSNEFKGAGHYVLQNEADGSSSLVRAQIQCRGNVYLTKDNDEVFGLSLTQEDFSRKLHGKVIWVCRQLDFFTDASADFPCILNSTLISNKTMNGQAQ